MTFILTETVIRKEVALIACGVKGTTDYEREMDSDVAGALVAKLGGREFDDLNILSNAEIEPAVIAALMAGF